MTRRSSNRNKKVPVIFNDMIYDLSTKGTKSKNSCGEDMVKLVENDKKTWENGAVTESGIDGGRSEDEIEEVAECLGMGKKTFEATGMDPNSSNVCKSGNDDFPSPSFSFCEKLIEKQGNLTDNVENNSYVKALSKNLIESNNKLFIVPTKVNDKGEAIVIFDEELVNEESEKWKFTVCGYFVGSSLPIYEMKYNIRRMRGKHGLKDIVVDRDEICFAKFKDQERMNLVIEQSPWMVNGRPFIVQKWDPEVTIVKTVPCKIPVWIKLFNVPLESWSTKGINIISSRLGRPIMMDKMTADMTEEEQIKSDIAGNKGKSKDGFTDVRNGKNFNGFGGNYNRRQCGNQGVKTMFVPKVPTALVMDKVASDKQSENINKDPPARMAEAWNIGKTNVEELKKSANKYAVLAEINEENPKESKAMERGDNDDSDEEDVEIVYDESVQAVIADEIEGRGS
ncbi:RNA-directed DNA polymerase, eukaryota, reverse transcriptase zinc-binding domain protein, partial [Tanacetum coccineum]